MKVTHTAMYDAPADDVRDMLLAPSFREYAARATGVLEVEAWVEETDEGRVVTIDQVQPTDGVPAFAKKFAGETTRAIVTETWTSPENGSLVIRTPGRPTEISGSYLIEDLGDSTRILFEGEVKAKVPLIKDKLERLVAQFFLEGKEGERSAGNAWLAGER
jgi:hypothetical protein